MPTPTITEHSLISGYLISNTHLVDSLPFQTFQKLFPSAYRSHPDVKILHAHLTRKRNKLRSHISTSIARHVQRTEDAGDIAEETNGPSDVPVIDNITNQSSLSTKLSLTAAIDLLSKTSSSIASDIDYLERECKSLQRLMDEQIGQLSDLRYGGGPQRKIRQGDQDPLEAKVEQCVGEINVSTSTLYSFLKDHSNDKDLITACKSITT